MKIQRREFAALLGAGALNACASTESWSLGGMPEPKRVLIFSHSTGFRHDAIEAGVAALQALCAREGYTAQATEDPDVFSEQRLSGVNTIILVSTTSDGRNPESEWFVGARRNALQNFVRGGGGIVGIHAAGDSHRHWPWYRRMIGGLFESHPFGTPTATLNVVDSRHPSTKRLPATFARTDEWYYYADYDPTVRLLVTFDPQSIGAQDINPNPISWCHEFEGGRVFYTGMGHTAESYAEPIVLEHLRGGLRWALRLEN